MYETYILLRNKEKTRKKGKANPTQPKKALLLLTAYYVENTCE